MDKEQKPSEEPKKPQEPAEETASEQKTESKPEAESKPAPEQAAEKKPEKKAEKKAEKKPAEEKPASAPKEASTEKPESPKTEASSDKPASAAPQGRPQSDAPSSPPPGRRGRRGGPGRGEGGRGRGDDRRSDRPESEWEEKIIQVRRVTKVVKGGKKLSFRAVVAVGNGKGQVGIGIGKASEVIMAIQKGIADAKKSLINVPIIKTTIPHEIIGKQGSSRILLKPAAKGTGVIAGGASRAILELAGIGDVLSKSLGSRSPLNVARATINGLNELRTFEEAARLRGITVRQMLS